MKITLEQKIQKYQSLLPSILVKENKEYGYKQFYYQKDTQTNVYIDSIVVNKKENYLLIVEKVYAFEDYLILNLYHKKRTFELILNHKLEGNSFTLIWDGKFYDNWLILVWRDSRKNYITRINLNFLKVEQKELGQEIQIKANGVIFHSYYGKEVRGINLPNLLSIELSEHNEAKVDEQGIHNELLV